MKQLKKLADVELLDFAVLEWYDIIFDEEEGYIFIVEILLHMTVWKYQIGQLLVILDI